MSPACDLFPNDLLVIHQKYPKSFRDLEAIWLITYLSSLKVAVTENKNGIDSKALNDKDEWRRVINCNIVGSDLDR